jgi:ribosomal protein S18 acetylase RimI-like enzyme
VSRSAKALAAGFAVRPMWPADAARVAEVHVGVWREAYAALLPADYLAGLSVAVFSERWAARLASPAPGVVHLVGLDPAGDVVGIATAGPSRDRPAPTLGELWAINVLAGAHGTGLADLMMDTLVSDDPVSLWVLQGNDRAIAFYRRHGFVADGAAKPFSPTGALEHRMVRGLRPWTAALRAAP